MSRRQRREHKKQLARRRNGRNRAAMALAAAAAIAAGTQAYADPVRFDNPPGPGHFDWYGPPVWEEWLELTLPAADQPGVGTSPSVIRQGNTGTFSLVGEGFSGTVEVEVANAYLDLLAVARGQLIPTGAPWNQIGYIYYSGYGSQLPEGQATYLGVRFDLGAGTQYGWIGGVRTGMDFDAFAWGYETTPGVPIPAGIPEPGTLALLAFGAAAALRKRRPA